MFISFDLLFRSSSDHASFNLYDACSKEIYHGLWTGFICITVGLSCRLL